MLLKLATHISNCLERAVDAEQRALEAQDSASRRDHELLAQSWRHLARSYEFVETLERFLSETDRKKKDIIAPEMLAFVGEPRVEPDSKPIIRRPRVKHETSFKDRLLKSAQDARDEAARLPAGSARNQLLQKVRQSENAVSIDTWISSPGSAPPDHFAAPKKPQA